MQDLHGILLDIASTRADLGVLHRRPVHHAGRAANPLSHILTAIDEPLDLIQYNTWNILVPEGEYLTEVPISILTPLAALSTASVDIGTQTTFFKLIQEGDSAELDRITFHSLL